jgi:hypothetical protein
MGGGYQGRFAETVLRTSMDAGAAKLRGRFTAAPRQIEVTFRMTAAQVAVLRDFYQETTGGGALPFDWVHPREGGSFPGLVEAGANAVRTISPAATRAGHADAADMVWLVRREITATGLSSPMRVVNDNVDVMRHGWTQL